MAIQAQKIALRTNSKQEERFQHHLNYARVAYNAARSELLDGMERNEYLSVYDIKKLWNARKREVFPEFADCSQHVAKNAVHALADATTRWFSKQNGRPKRKNRKSKPSFQIDNGVDSIKLTEDRRYVILPKMGRVRLKESPRWDGVIRRAFISRKASTWYLSITMDVDEPEPPDTSHLPAAGCDVGISALATMDDGTLYENPRALRHHERKIRRANKSLARKKFLSKNWYKALDRLTKVHARVANIRMNAHHQVTHRILQGISALGIESLTVKGLMKNRKLSKALADAALSGFLVKLKYKAVRRGIRIVEADRFWPSTKRCSSCGNVKNTLSLSDRTYHCGICGFIADRDINAAINLRQLASSTDESLNACGDAVRPTLVGWHRNPRTRGRSRKPLTSQIIIDYAGFAQVM